MNSCLNRPPVERAQPRLGTLVSLRVEGLQEATAHRAIDAAFAEIATVHQRMSFHYPQSDVSRLNRSALHGPVEVHPWTFAVIEYAQHCSQASKGCFDISVGAALVKSGALAAPAHAPALQNGSWRDIELLPDSCVVFHRPLWIDLGGIAKGFAVDRAAERLAEFGPIRAVVNAGGDLRVLGSEAERIRLGAPSSDCVAPILELADGSAAGSSSLAADARHDASPAGAHLDAMLRRPAPTGRFACVVAEHCMTADALTKVVIAQGKASDSVLRQFGATAWMKDWNSDWRRLGAEIA
jgi:thiamine biosynthesis lipoprotein